MIAPKTKIICTIGPASGTEEIIRALIKNGMSVARLNFSHGTHDGHLKLMQIIRSVSQEENKPVAILQDLCGPKIRIGEVHESGIRLDPGQTFFLTSKPVMGTKDRVSVNYQSLPDEVRKGDRIMLADGVMEMVVMASGGTEIECQVITGGVLTSHKGVNLPSGTIKAPALTDKDIADLAFGLDNDVDYIGLSFVRSPEDIILIKERIQKQGKDTPVIAKIEKHEALRNIDEIIRVADGIMVARGDLGVEIPLETIPNVQKSLVRKANIEGKPVIIATQMLRSMVDSPRPTRAEATDVANAILDGADAVMLSEETASGNYPVEAVQFMSRIALSAETAFPHDSYLKLVPKKEVSESVAHASCVLSDHLDAAGIVAPTRSGYTAKQISRFRPRGKIIALSPEPVTIRRLALYWGCLPSLVADAKDTDALIEKSAKTALETGHVVKGDLVIITAGHPVWVPGLTKMLRVKKL